MTESRRHAAGRRRKHLYLATIVGTALGAGLAAGSAIALKVARLVLIPPTTREEHVRVLAVDRRAETVTFVAHPDVSIPGNYTYFFDADASHARVGDIIALADGQVTRRLIAEDAGSVAVGSRGRISAWYYLSPAELDVPYEDVVIDTDVGPAPAWLVPATTPSESWVLQVHGRGVDRREPVRGIPVFRDAGYTSLIVSYRNDGVAPASGDGRYALGDTEWRDVDDALRFAVEHGARSIVLMGWSMGGAIVLQTVTRSRFAPLITGLVLESPVIDWMRVLNYQARELHIPAPIRRLVFRLISSGWSGRLTGQDAPINLQGLDFVRRAADIRVPTLILHSDADSYVPADASRELAALRPDTVTLERFSGAGHTRLWNYDAKRWNGAIRNWLADRE